MAELTAILKASRDKTHSDRKFLAAVQGIDLDEGEGRGQQEWENLKARVASNGTATDANDVLSLQGKRASSLGFGIGLGLEAEKIDSDGTVTKLG